MAAYRICFVCLGNICRSPTAEVVFRALLAEHGLDGAVEVSSAGTSDWHAGEPADRRAAEAMVARGYDPSGHRARQFVARMFARTDLVVAMDSDNERTLRRLAPDAADAAKVRLLRSYDPDAVAAGDLDVPDPYYGGPGGFDAVLDIVERACRGLLDDVRRRLAA